MKATAQSDPVGKRVLRWGWRRLLDGWVFLFAHRPRKGDLVRVFYGGARPGNFGGPKVKVQRLQQFFPEHRLNYNLVYSLSNTPYLSEGAVETLVRRRVPIVHNQNGVFYPAWFNGDWEAKNAEMAIAYHRADHVFFQSEFCRKSAETYLGVRKGRGEVLFNAIDTTHFKPRSDFDRAGQPFRFLVTGKIDQHMFYRLESSIRGLSAARDAGLDARLEIAGWLDGSAEGQAEALSASLGVTPFVELTGPYTQEAAPNVYKRADAYIMTKHNDPCPNTVLEAMSCGLPVLFARSGGVPELVADCGVGLISEEGWDEVFVPDAASVAEGMKEIVRRHAGLARAARMRAETHFEINNWIERHQSVFNDLMLTAREGLNLD